jgi:hypothetical protein
MSHLQLIAYWIGINVVLGVFGPLIVGYLFADFAVHPPKLTLRKFYSKGELAFASLLIALTVIVDVLKSHFAPHTTELLSPVLVSLLSLQRKHGQYPFASIL